jgi:predicted DNA binding CopG/RHH family protein
MKKPLPALNSDAEAEAFVASADLTDYDLSGITMVKFEFQPKTERVNLGRKSWHAVSALYQAGSGNLIASRKALISTST